GAALLLISPMLGDVAGLSHWARWLLGGGAAALVVAVLLIYLRSRRVRTIARRARAAEWIGATPQLEEPPAVCAARLQDAAAQRSEAGSSSSSTASPSFRAWASQRGAVGIRRRPGPSRPAAAPSASTPAKTSMVGSRPTRSSPQPATAGASGISAVE